MVGPMMMAIGAVLSVALAVRLRREVQLEHTIDGTENDGIPPAAGPRFDRRVISIIRSQPVAACAVVAVVGAAAVMVHAETTFAGSVPYGLAECGAVVLGFVFAGPPLGVRSRTCAV
jgi:hypothetical protein